jgi:hypothetical protein
MAEINKAEKNLFRRLGDHIDPPVLKYKPGTMPGIFTKYSVFLT